MKTVNFALLGCGQISQKHVNAIKHHVPGGRIVAVCDRNQERAAAVAALAGCPHYLSIEQMMGEAGGMIDVVSVLTPTGNHVEDVLTLSAFGKHTIVEKPMALTAADCRVMIDAARAANTRIFVVKQNRFNRPIRKVYEALQAGRFGRIVMATVRVRWKRDQTYYNRDPWRGTRAFDGGVLANQASHHLDLLLWLVGDIDTVNGYTARRLVDIETEDTAVGILKFRNGALGVIEATTATRPKDLEASLSILGEGGAVEIGGFATDEVRTWQFQNPTAEDIEIASGNIRNPEDRSFAHGQYLKEVVANLNGERSEAVEGLEAMRTVRLIEAFYRASETMMPTPLASDDEVSIRLPLSVGNHTSSLPLI